jgi:TonB family protein
LLFYPEQEWSSRLQGKKVRIKIKIDPFGKVTDAQLLMSCGNSVIDEAALRAVKKAEFDPSQIDITLFNKWMLIEIPVTKPARSSDWDMQ